MCQGGVVTQFAAIHCLHRRRQRFRTRRHRIVVVVVGGEGAIVVIVGTTIVLVVSVAVSPTPPGAADASLPPAAFRGTWTMGEARFAGRVRRRIRQIQPEAPGRRHLDGGWRRSTPAP